MRYRSRRESSISRYNEAEDDYRDRKSFAATQEGINRSHLEALVSTICDDPDLGKSVSKVDREGERGESERRVDRPSSGARIVVTEINIRAHLRAHFSQPP